MDDWPNLEGLQYAYNEGFWYYVLDGVSSFLGRPLSYISFALQHTSWPDHPGHFRLVNLFIHLLNAILVFLLISVISNYLKINNIFKIWLSVSVAVIWLFLPIHSTSAFYIVQRMTLLSASFTLLGLLVFFCLVRKFENEKLGKIGFVVLTCISTGLFYVLGILSKETAINLGVYLLALYFFLVRQNLSANNSTTRTIDFVCVVVGLLPLLMTALFIGMSGKFEQSYYARHFTISERFLTEFRILWSYIDAIVLPRAGNINLYNDHFRLSSGLFTPFSTTLAITAWLALLIAPLFFNKRLRLLVYFVLVWFLGGHILESLSLGLELAFQHRNYLPSLGLVLAIMVGVFGLLSSHSYQDQGFGLKCKIIVIAIIAYGAWNAVVLRIEAVTWGNPMSLALSTLSERSNSIRGNQYAAAVFANQGHYQQAIMILDKIESKWPGYPGTTASKLMCACLSDKVAIPDLGSMKNLYRNGRFDRGVVPSMKEVLSIKERGGCEFLSFDEYRAMLEGLYNNKKFIGQRENILILISFAFNAQKNYQAAAETLARQPFEKSEASYILLRARFEIWAGNNIKARELLDKLIQKRSATKGFIIIREAVTKLQNQLKSIEENQGNYDEKIGFNSNSGEK